MLFGNCNQPCVCLSGYAFADCPIHDTWRNSAVIPSCHRECSWADTAFTYHASKFPGMSPFTTRLIFSFSTPILPCPLLSLVSRLNAQVDRLLSTLLMKLPTTHGNGAHSSDLTLAREKRLALAGSRLTGPYTAIWDLHSLEGRWYLLSVFVGVGKCHICNQAAIHALTDDLETSRKPRNSILVFPKFER